jgi:hypothetical protein
MSNEKVSKRLARQVKIGQRIKEKTRVKFNKFIISPEMSECIIDLF